MTVVKNTVLKKHLHKERDAKPRDELRELLRDEEFASFFEMFPFLREARAKMKAKRTSN